MLSDAARSSSPPHLPPPPPHLLPHQMSPFLSPSHPTHTPLSAPPSRSPQATPRPPRSQITSATVRSQLVLAPPVSRFQSLARRSIDGMNRTRPSLHRSKASTIKSSRASIFTYSSCGSS
ncbi:hypothetical protein BD779DRAFT_32464 [Infundibulicybe gibba]|nr:hypothetical protein BD779DRAFT_32464 [Infundibulicybe gibba]